MSSEEVLENIIKAVSSSTTLIGSGKFENETAKNLINDIKQIGEERGGFIHPSPELVKAKAEAYERTVKADTEAYKERKSFDLELKEKELELIPKRVEARTQAKLIGLEFEKKYYPLLKEVEINRKYLRKEMEKLQNKIEKIRLAGELERREIRTLQDIEIDKIVTRGAMDVKRIEYKEGFKQFITYRCGHTSEFKNYTELARCTMPGCDNYVCPTCMPRDCGYHRGLRAIIGGLIGK